MELVLAPSPDFKAWTSERAGEYAASRQPDQMASLWPTSRLAPTLETIRIQLEGDKRGSRYPLMARLAEAMAFEPVTGWETPELPALLGEIEAIKEELERLGLEKQAVVHFGDDGSLEVYSRESKRLPELEARMMGDKAARNLWEKNRGVLAIVAATAQCALDQNMGVMIW